MIRCVIRSVYEQTLLSDAQSLNKIFHMPVFFFIFHLEVRDLCKSFRCAKNVFVPMCTRFLYSFCICMVYSVSFLFSFIVCVSFFSSSHDHDIYDFSSFTFATSLPSVSSMVVFDRIP